MAPCYQQAMGKASGVSGRDRQNAIWDLAFEEAGKAAARGETPVGAVIALDGKVLASAGNRTLELRDPTAHAEVLAIRMACVASGSERLPGADLYVTLEPCTLCAGAISFARIRRLYYAASDAKGGAVDSGVRFFSQPTCHHAPEVYGGFREAEAAEILRKFFRERRQGADAGDLAPEPVAVREKRDISENTRVLLEKQGLGQKNRP
jgi:tRNA(adenine34) deaminase